MSDNRNRKRHQITMDQQVWNQLKEETKSVSRKLEELSRSWLSASGNEVGELEERKYELEQKLEELEEKKSEFEEKTSDIQSELKSIETSLQRKEAEESRIDKAVDSLIDKVPRKGVNGDRTAEARVNQLTSKRVYHNQLEKVDVDSEELQERIIQKLED